MFNGKLPLSDVTDAYWRFYEAFHGEQKDEATSEANWWSTEIVSGLLRRGGPLAIEVVVALSDSAPDQEALEYVGAGVIEDLFNNGSYEYPDNSERLELLDAEVRRNPKVRAAFQGSWDHALPAQVAEQLRKYRPSE